VNRSDAFCQARAHQQVVAKPMQGAAPLGTAERSVIAKYGADEDVEEAAEDKEDEDEA
jgi:hypothetical protein